MSDDYDESRIAEVERGRSSLSFDGLTAAAITLRVSTDWLLGLTYESSGYGVTFVPLYPDPVADGTTSGTVIAPKMSAPHCFSRHRLEADRINRAKARVYQVVGDSMCPTLIDGSRILVDKGSTDPRPNHLFVIQAAGPLLEKRFRRHQDSWWWCDNEAFDPIRADDSIKVWGRVRWSMRRFNDDGH